MKRVIAVVTVAVVFAAQAGFAESAKTKQVQQRLESVGFRPGPIDGIYGPKTRAAVRAFQVASEIPASGWVDARTLAMLDETLMLRTEPPVAQPSAPVVVAQVDADDARVDEMFRVAEVDVRRVRLAAVEVLGELKTPRARASLGTVLYRNGIPDVRAAAARKLGAFRDAESVYTLALALEEESDAKVSAVIAEEIEKSLPIQPMDHAVALSGAWEGELVSLLPPPPPPSPWQEIEETATPVESIAVKHACEGRHEKGVCLKGSWVVASLDAPALEDAHGVLVPVEPVWGHRLDVPEPRRPLARGELEPTEDALVVRGRARLGAYVVNVNGEPARLDVQGYFVYQLNGEPRGEISLVVQEIDIEGRTTERVVSLSVPPPTAVALGR